MCHKQLLGRLYFNPWKLHKPLEHLSPDMGMAGPEQIAALSDGAAEAC